MLLFLFFASSTLHSYFIARAACVACLFATFGLISYIKGEEKVDGMEWQCLDD
jgi:hypothetical protein